MNIGKEIIELSKDLIRFRSIENNPNELKKIRDFVANYLRGYGKIRKFEFNRKPCLFASLDGNKKPEILLAGHLDVVDGEKDQFIPKIKGNKLFGRGATDMKSGVAIYMLLYKNLAKLGCKSLGIMLSCDEECGGHNGAKLLSKMGYSGKFIITSEPSKSKLNIFNICNKEKGLLRLKIKSIGKSAHSSRPWQGENAADKLINIYLEIKKLFPKISKNKWKSSCSLGIFSAGHIINKVPDYAEMYLDIRWIDELNSKKILQKIKNILKNKRGVYIKIINDEPMLKSDKKNYNIKILKSIIEKNIGKKSKFVSEHAASDLRFFSERKIPSFILGPHGKNIHGSNEFVYISSIKKIYKIMEEFILISEKCDNNPRFKSIGNKR